MNESSTRVSAAPTRTGAGMKALVVGLMLAGGATIGLAAWAQPGPGMMGGGMFGGPSEHMARGLDHLLDGLNASDAQRTQVKQIAQAAAADVKAQHEAGRALRDKAMQIFAAPTVDAAAAESVRQQMLAQHDQVSRRMLQAMLDVSKVLTPEQRAKAAERMKLMGAQRDERMQRMERERAHP
jgi:Spy/CpxP family protein refolding chaperone